VSFRTKVGAVLAASVAGIVFAACGGGASSAPPPTTPARTPSAISTTPAASSTCAASSTTLEIAALAHPTNPTAFAFEPECLAAPAGTRFTIAFDNRDNQSHNIHILDHPGGTSLLQGTIIVGPKKITYTVKPLDPGTYYFRCDIHPLRMNGTLNIG